MSDTFFLIVGILVSLIGFICLLAGITLRIQCTKKIEAVIQNVKQKHHVVRLKAIIAYHPIFHYEEEGKTYTHTAEIFSFRPKKYVVGNPLTVWINPKKPSEYCFSTHIGSLVGDVAIMVAGLTLVVCYFL